MLSCELLVLLVIFSVTLLLNTSPRVSPWTSDCASEINIDGLVGTTRLGVQKSITLSRRGGLRPGIVACLGESISGRHTDGVASW